jgi:GT2 family glycosyltransferase
MWVRTGESTSFKSADGTRRTSMISVIVLGYNNSSYTRCCIEHLAASAGAREFEFILMDNASTDDTPALARQVDARFGRFKYVRNEVNLSCSKALNRAAELSAGRVLVFLNNDIYVGHQSVSRLVEALLSDSRIGLTGTTLVYPDGQTIQHAGVVPMLWGYASNYGVGAAAGDERFSYQREMFAVTGCRGARFVQCRGRF